MHSLHVRSPRGRMLQDLLLPEDTLALEDVLLLHRHKPVEDVLSEDLREIVPRSNIIRVLLLTLLALLAIRTASALPHHGLQCSGILEDHAHMHLEEHEQSDK